MTNILFQYYQKFPFVFDYFNFLRDSLLALQLILVFGFILTSGYKSVKISFKSALVYVGKNIFYYFLIFLLSFLLAAFFKYYFPSLRPDGTSYDSFPSRHTLISFALSLALLLQNFKLGLLSLSLTILIAIFSILSLRHWLIDVIFGFIFGFVIFWIVYKFLKLSNWFDIDQRQSKT